MLSDVLEVKSKEYDLSEISYKYSFWKTSEDQSILHSDEPVGVQIASAIPSSPLDKLSLRHHVILLKRCMNFD